jgi:hypothetical protein
LGGKAKSAGAPKAKVAATPPRAGSGAAKRGSADKPTIQ